MTGPDFESYLGDYEKVSAILLSQLSATSLPMLEWATIRLMYALEYNELGLKDGDEGDFLRVTLVRIANECHGIVGCMKQGAFHASFHHTRAIWELFASLGHIFGKTEKRQRKLDKFKEFSQVCRYLHHVECKKDLDSGKLSTEEFQQTCKVSDKDFQELQLRIPEWIRIWKLKEVESIKEITHWHHPSTIQGLFDSCDETRDSWHTYELFCHMTHLSPLGAKATGGYFLIGFPKRPDGKLDVRLTDRPIAGALLGLQKTLLFLTKANQIEPVHDVLALELKFD